MLNRLIASIHPSWARRVGTGAWLPPALLCSLLVLGVLLAPGGRANKEGKGGAAATTPSSTEDKPCPQESLKQRAIVKEVETDQDTLNNHVAERDKDGHFKQRPDGSIVVNHKRSGYYFQEVVARGRHLFTTPFTEADGAGEGTHFSNGEGALGPREKDFNSNLRLIQGKLQLPDSALPKLLDLFQPPFSHIDSKGNVRFSILRLNGLDSQSCFECHNSIGSAHLVGDPPRLKEHSRGGHDPLPAALERKPGTTGGPAGQASNAFINDTFPNPVLMFVRNPPHVFGTGYVLKLSEKMTQDLLHQKFSAYYAATLKPGTEISLDLYSTDGRGRPVIHFGNHKVTYIGDPRKVPDENTLLARLFRDAEVDLSKDFREDDSAVMGVSRDLVVRPLQWKGIASNERNFVRSALKFHFGMAPRELNPDYLQPQENHDPDSDGIKDEVSEGNVSALTIFTMSLRPPVQDRSSLTDEQRKRVERGEKLFRGQLSGLVSKETSCASCHMPELPLYDTHLCVRDPRDDVPLGQPQFVNTTSLVARQRSSKNLPAYHNAYQKIRQRLRRMKKIKPADAKEMSARELAHKLRQHMHEAALARPQGGAPAQEPVGCPASGYELDLNMEAGSESESLSFSYPRLPLVDDSDSPTKKAIQVPLFSDLKRHDMGEGLSDKFDQGTDVDSIKVERRLFLTRPLWGVADTGPWLHDGRARTLRDAILMHESLGSEANPVIERFRQLSCDDQAAIVEFLLTFRLPLDCRFQTSVERPANCRPKAMEAGPGRPSETHKD